MDTVECVIIGAGVVGLAIAHELSQANIEVLVLEQHEHIGTETSARNSEVIHAGIYYPPGSLKARLCLQGKTLLYEFCQTHQIPHQRCGKLIIAQGPQGLADLKKLQENARRCGVTDLQLLDAAAVARLEPEVLCDAALLSPSTGIIDSHQLMLGLQGLAEHRGAQFVFNTPVSRLQKHPNQGYLVYVDEYDYELHCHYLINAGGIHAPLLGADLTPAPVPQQYCRGQYFSYQGKNPFQRLIYPLPPSDSLGIHSCHDMAGQLRFGPDVQWMDHIDYAPDPQRRDWFYQTIRSYWPNIDKHKLQPDFCGIRPKITAPGEPAADFQILGPKNHGQAGLIQLFGIESPGLTSSLAIGRYVRQLLWAH